MPSPIVRSLAVRAVGPKDTSALRVTARTEGNTLLKRVVVVPSMYISSEILLEPTDRLVRGGEGLSDTSPMPGRLDSLKIKTSSSRLYATSEVGLISETQKDARATTTAVVIAAPRAEALQVTAQWRDA